MSPSETGTEHWLAVADLKELSPGKPKIADVENIRIALFKIAEDERSENKGIYCIEDVCTHDDGPVAEGPVEGDVIECPRHGARFNIKTGAVLSMPAVTPVRSFPVRVIGTKVEVKMGE